jgi:hypothetical protein
MPYTLTIHTDGAAFEDEHQAAAELARILRRLADGLDRGAITPEDETRLYDVNGNNVGRAHTVELPPVELTAEQRAALVARAKFTGGAGLPHAHFDDLAQAVDQLTA